MPDLTPLQVEQRGHLLADLVVTDSSRVCPCCKRPFTFGLGRATRLFADNLKAINALVAVLSPDEGDRHA